MSDTQLVNHHGLQTARAAGFRLYDSQLDPGDYADVLRHWLVLAHVTEATIYEFTNMDAAYDKLKRRYGADAARHLFDVGWNACLLLVNPDNEDAVIEAVRLGRDIRHGVHVDDFRYNMAVVEKADELWAAADLPRRIDWLLGTTESLDRAFGNDCPHGAARHIVDYCRL